MPLRSLGSTKGCSLQAVVKGRGSVSPALSFSGLTSFRDLKIPSLSGHFLAMVTFGGSQGVSRKDAIDDIKSVASWFAEIACVTPAGRLHVHHIGLFPNSCLDWLKKQPVIYRGGRSLPRIVYSRGETVEPCDAVFSIQFNEDGPRQYLAGHENQASSAVILKASFSWTVSRRATSCPVRTPSPVHGGSLPLPPGRHEAVGVKPWKRDASAARSAAMLRNGTAERLGRVAETTRKQKMGRQLSPSAQIGCSPTAGGVPEVIRSNSGYL